MNGTDIFDRFARDIPVATMVRGLIEHLFDPASLNGIPAEVELFTYTRSIEFAHLVGLMADVVFRVHPSVRAAYRKSPARHAATLKSVYEKLAHVEPAVCRAFVRRVSDACERVMAEWGPGRPSPVPGLRCRRIDGNKLAATQRRLDGLEYAYAPLPGQALVLQDAATGLFVDLCPGEDAHQNERRLFGGMAGAWRPADLVVADRNFCTEEFFRQVAAAGAFFVVRHHGSVGLHPAGPEHPAGRCPTGGVVEQRVRYAESDLEVRCVTVRLDEPTRDGDRVVRVLTNLDPARAPAVVVAETYRGRRGIEAAFQELEAAVRSEIDTLAYPKAAVFGFGMGLALCNLFQVVKAALAATPSAPEPEDLSGVVLGHEVGSYLGALLLLPLPPTCPRPGWTPRQVACWLQAVAGGADWSAYRKARRGPKKRKAFDRGYGRQGNTSTARVIAQRATNKTRAP
jgi:hypothetical protein